MTRYFPSSFRRLEVFITVVESGGVVAGAERLGISHPSVSNHIKSLERPHRHGPVRTCWASSLEGVPSLRRVGCAMFDSRWRDSPSSHHLPPGGGRASALCRVASRPLRAEGGSYRHEGQNESPPVVTVLAAAVVGFAAGITGIGGGILLAPLMLARKWGTVRETVGVSAAFNLVNSSAALAGLWMTSRAFVAPPWPWLLAVICGGRLAHGSACPGYPPGLCVTRLPHFC
jgi:hypothetical protein